MVETEASANNAQWIVYFSEHASCQVTQKTLPKEAKTMTGWVGQSSSSLASSRTLMIFTFPLSQPCARNGCRSSQCQIQIRQSPKGESRISSSTSSSEENFPHIFLADLFWPVARTRSHSHKTVQGPTSLGTRPHRAETEHKQIKKGGTGWLLLDSSQ